MLGVFSTAYLPPINWFAGLLQYDAIAIERHESWQKQSYRNRCYILGPNGAQMLNIPVVHTGQKKSIEQVQMNSDENWRNSHWQAIKTAYGSSPFFEILGPELEEKYRNGESNLLGWNTDLIKLMLNWLQCDLELDYTAEWKVELSNDHRESFHPKRPLGINSPPYPQVFNQKLEFVPNLSILDLLFNEGPAAYGYLKHLG